MKARMDLIQSVVVCLLLLFPAVCLAQPTMDRRKLPQDMPAEVKAAVDELYAKDPIKRGNAAIALREFREAALRPAVPVLMSMLGDNAALRFASQYNPFGGTPTSPGEEAAKTVGKLGEESVQPLAAALGDKNRHVRKCAAAGLGETASPAALDPLIDRVAKEPYADVTAKLITSIGKLPGPKGNDALIAALKDKDWDVRTAAAEAVEKRNDPRAAAPLRQMIKEARAQDRQGAIIAAERALDAVSTPQEADARLYDDLTTAVRARDWITSERIAVSLWSRRIPRTVGPLLQMLKDARAQKRAMSIEWAEKALENNTGIAGSGKDKEWQQWWDSQNK